MSNATGRYRLPVSLFLFAGLLANAAPRIRSAADFEKDRDEDHPALETAPTAAMVARARLGISIQSLDGNLSEALGLKPEQGALITAVASEGPGAEAGLKRGDVIMRVDDAVVRDADGLVAALAKIKPGREADLTLQRGIKTLELTVTPGRFFVPPAGKRADAWDENEKNLPGRERLGLKVADPDRWLRRKYATGSGVGVVVLGVEEGSRAQTAGLREGDFLLEADRRGLSSTRELQAAVAYGRKRGRLALLVKRGDEVFYVAVRFTGA